MTTPNPPGPQPQPTIVGTNSLAGRLDALTRAVTTLSNRFSAAGGGGGMNMSAFGPMGGQTNYGTMRTDIQQRQTIGQMVRDRQRVMNERIFQDPNRSQSARDDALSREEIQRTQFQHAQQRMNNQLQALHAQQRQQTTMNRMAIAGTVAGSVVGAAKSYYSGGFEEMAGQYGRRLALRENLGSGGVGQRAERAAGEGFRYGLHNMATSNEDYFGGMLTIKQQAFMRNQPSMMRSAASLALTNPGLGIQGAAQVQGELGTAQAFYTSQMFGITPTRGPGGTQATPGQIFASMQGRTFGGRQISQDELSESLKQGGSMAISLQNYGRAAGLSGMALEAMANQGLAINKLTTKGRMSQQEAQDTLAAAAENNAAGRAARRKLANAGLKEIGGSYEDAKNFLAGRSREGHLAQTAGFNEAAVASANTLADIYNLLNKALGPIADVMGGIAGAWKGGGALGTAGTALKAIGGGSGWQGLGRTLTNSGSPILGGIASGLGPTLGRLFGGDRGTPESKQGGGKKGGGKDGPTSANMGSVIGFARAQIGDRYILGADGPDAWDCSSLTEAAYRQIGMNIGPNTWAQIKQGVEVGMDELLPGDLVFYKDLSHVGLYEGNGRVVEAANPGRGVVEGPMYGKFQRARRIVAGGLKAQPTQGGKQKDPTKSWSGGGGGGGVGGAYGSISEVDALAAALGGGGGGVSLQTGSRTPSSQQNEEAAGGTTGGNDQVTDTRANVALGRKLAATYGWTGKEFDALYKLWMGESNWNHHADNPNSDAYGIPQAMSNLHKETATEEWRNSPEKQITWGLNYIKRRYTTPSKALSFWQKNNPHWYAAGAWNIPGDQDARLHQGEMVLDRNSAHTVRQALLMQGLTPSGGSSEAGGSANVNLNFGSGSIIVQMPSATVEGAKAAAEQFVASVAADERIKSMLGGW